MTSSPKLPLKRFYSTREAPCPYLSGQLERKVFTELDGDDRDPVHTHEALTAAGFRRSHSIAYKPVCEGCSACIPVRVRVAEFIPTRSMRRVITRNRLFTAVEQPAFASTEQYEIFARYVASRHGDGGMAEMDFVDYVAMIEETPIETSIVEFRDSCGVLQAAALTDYLRDGLSMVYSFFDPACERQSLGTYMILWHVATAVERNLDYLYLGYWIKDSQKMSYKTRFKPVEGLLTNTWTHLSIEDQSISGSALPNDENAGA